MVARIAGSVTYPIACGAHSEGPNGRYNQDRCRLSDKGFVLCDGVGGLDEGGLFAEMAAWKTNQRLQKGDRADAALNEALVFLSDFRRKSGINGGVSESAVSFGDDGSCSICSIGDTRAFLVGRVDVVALNQPDVDARGNLTAYIGGACRAGWRNSVMVTASQFEESAIVIMSDGVWKYITESDLLEVCTSPHLTTEKAAIELVTRAKRCCSRDDRTAVICRRWIQF